MDDRPLTVVCAGFDWRHPSPLRHLEIELARVHRVVHVESIGLRRPRPGPADLSRMAWKLGRVTGLIAPPDGGDGVEVLAPWALPLPANASARALNGWALERSVRRRIGPDPVDLFLTALPTALEFQVRLRARISAYYRVDDWPRWPRVDGDVVSGLERGMMDRVDLTFATSRPLTRDGRSRGGPAIHLPQGVDREHFARAMTSGPTLPALAGLRRPVLGMFGTLDDRVDWPLLATLARGWPGTIVLAGPKLPASRPMPDPSAVRWIGPVPYRDLPCLARGVDVWLLPYVLGARTAAIDPLKLREYLATGLPVVATPLPELDRWRPIVRLGATGSELHELALAAAADPATGRTERLDSLEGEGWDERARVFMEHVRALLPRAGAPGRERGMPPAGAR